MKTICQRFITLFLAFSIVCAFPSNVFAATSGETVQPQASNYIASTMASIYGNDGIITVKFSIVATRVMDSIGATVIRIKDVNGNVVKTFYSSTTDGMMDSGRAIFSGSVTYNATKGQKYYAVVSFKAADSTGGDSDSYTTAYATA